jgi:hypothetical protein
MIQGFCRVVCPPCGRWLLIMEGGMDTTAAYPDLATAFPSVPAAEKALANAGWLDHTCRRCQRARATKEVQPA